MLFSMPSEAMRGSRDIFCKRFLRFWFLPLLYSGIIFYISSLPDIKTPLGGIRLDKLLHIFEYIPFGFLLARAFVHTRRNLSGGILFGLVTSFTFLYGMSDEYHQSFVPGRDASIADVFADSIGGMVGAFFYFYIGKFKGSVGKD